MTSPVNTQIIHQILQKTFEPEKLNVIDEESLHTGHTHQGQGHFRIVIRSSHFCGKTPVQIHRMIYNALQMYLSNGIHALAIDAQAIKP